MKRDVLLQVIEQLVNNWRVAGGELKKVIQISFHNPVAAGIEPGSESRLSL